jgi:hypothetical protein
LSAPAGTAFSAPMRALALSDWTQFALRSAVAVAALLTVFSLAGILG